MVKKISKWAIESPRFRKIKTPVINERPKGRFLFFNESHFLPALWL